MEREDELNYEKCAHCWHFVQPNYETQIPGYAHLTLAEYVHLDNGEKEHDHDAAPSGDVRTLGTWKRDQPALFHRYADGSTGPNSSLFQADRILNRGQIQDAITAWRDGATFDAIHPLSHDEPPGIFWDDNAMKDLARVIFHTIQGDLGDPANLRNCATQVREPGKKREVS
jgi:hypothetical protein